MPARVSRDSHTERQSKVVSKSRENSIFSLLKGPKLRGPFAEDALAKQYFEQRSLVTE